MPKVVMMNLLEKRVAEFASMLFRENRNLSPDEESVCQRYAFFSSKIWEGGSLFEWPCCDGNDEGPCWLINGHDAWNDVLIPCGLQLQCYAAGWLSLTTIDVPSNRRTEMSSDELSSVLLVLWLLSEHHCINRVALDVCVAFGRLTEDFFQSVLFKPQLQQFKLGLPLAMPPLFQAGKTLLRSLKHTTSLETFELIYIPLSRYDVDQFCSILDSNKKLKSVSLSNVVISVACANDLITAFNSCVTLERIHLSPILEGEGRVESLQDTVLGRSSVREISIDLYLINSFPFECLALSTNIEVLKIGESVGLPHMLNLAQALKWSNVLRVLMVSLSACRNYHVFAALADALAVNTGLREMHLRNLTAIGDIAPYFARAIVANRTLQTLTIEGHSLRAIDVKMFAVSLLGNRSLKQLKLRGSQSLNERLQGLPEILSDTNVHSRLFLDFGPTYIPFLTRLLKRGKRLESLSLVGRNGIKSSEVISFIMSVRLNYALSSLNVCLSCKLPRPSVNHLAHLLRTSKSLRLVSLGLKMDTVDMCTICEGLEVNKNILRIKFDEVKFDKIAADALFKMLRANCSLTHLDIYGLDDGSARLLTERLPERLNGNLALLTMNLFKEPDTQIDTRECVGILCENQHRLSLAAGFVERTSTCDDSEEAFRMFSRSWALVDKLKKVTREPELLIREKIRLCLEYMTAK